MILRLKKHAPAPVKGSAASSLADLVHAVHAMQVCEGSKSDALQVLAEAFCRPLGHRRECCLVQRRWQQT